MKMRLVAAVMILTGLVVGVGAGLEFLYFGPSSRQFWVGVFTMPAGFLFAGAGVLLWPRGHGVRRVVLAAGWVMAIATLAATALDVMGPPATLVGVGGSLTALGWAWRGAAHS